MSQKALPYKKYEARGIRSNLVATGNILDPKILSSINLDKDIIKMDRIHKMGGRKSLYALLDISTRLQRELCWSTLVTVNISNVLFWPEQLAHCMTQSVEGEWLSISNSGQTLFMITKT